MRSLHCLRWFCEASAISITLPATSRPTRSDDRSQPARAIPFATASRRSPGSGQTISSACESCSCVAALNCCSSLSTCRTVETFAVKVHISRSPLRGFTLNVICLSSTVLQAMIDWCANVRGRGVPAVVTRTPMELISKATLRLLGNVWVMAYCVSRGAAVAATFGIIGGGAPLEYDTEALRKALVLFLGFVIFRPIVVLASEGIASSSPSSSPIDASGDPTARGEAPGSKDKDFLRSSGRIGLLPDIACAMVSA